MENALVEIKKSQGYTVGEKFCPLLKDAQVEALRVLLLTAEKDKGEILVEASINITTAAQILVEHAEHVIAILQPPSELRMRKIRKDKNTRRGSRTPKQRSELASEKRTAKADAALNAALNDAKQ